MTPLVSGLLYALLFPKFNFYLLFPVALVPLILFSLKSRLPGKKLFVYSTLSGALCHAVMLYWLYSVMIWNGVSYVPSVLALFFLSVYLGLYWGAFSLLVNRYRLSAAGFLLFLIPALWVSLEFIKTYLFSGFPWLLAGYSLWRTPVLLGISSVTGVYGLSFAVLLLNASIALALERKTLRPLGAAIGLFLFMGVWGITAEKDFNEGRALKTAILQGNISQYMKWDPDYENLILNTYERLHRQALKDAPDIIIWPETAMPGSLTSKPELVEYMKRLSGKSRAWQITGSFERGRKEFFNSAYSVNPEGEIRERYRKVHLTPFGEYVPFRGLFTPMVSVLDQFGDFSPGDEFKYLSAAGVKWAVGICYESIFPGLIRRGVKKGGEVFVNMTNDGWFLQTAGPHQHFIHSVLRSVENRIWTVRAANTGISAIIDPYGRIIKKTSLAEKTVLSGEVFPRTEKTFYTSYGDVFTGLIILVLIFKIWRREKCLKNAVKK